MNRVTLIPAVMCLIVLFVCCDAFSMSTDVSGIQIKSKNSEVRIGEPFVVELIVNRTSPTLQPGATHASNNWRQEGFFKISFIEDDPNSFAILKAFPLSLPIVDSEGLQYGYSFVIFYDALAQKLFFDKSGMYSVQYFLTKSEYSNRIEVFVNESIQSAKDPALLLSDPNDYFFLEFGDHFNTNKHSESISRLEEVARQYPDAILGKWCAARLGLEYFGEFHKKHPSHEKFRASKIRGQIQEPLFDRAHLYLTKGAALPDEFPIREKVLLELSVTEFINNELIRANFILDELATKYPQSKYGKKAVQGKAELEDLNRRESAQP